MAFPSPAHFLAGEAILEIAKDVGKKWCDIFGCLVKSNYLCQTKTFGNEKPHVYSFGKTAASPLA